MSQTKAQLLDNIKDNVQLDARNSLRFADTDSSHYVAFKAPATVSSNVTWTLPAADGSANYVLATDGSGNLSWIADPAGQWVTSGSNIYFTGGNVGIGDSSPSNPLSVTGASSFNGDVTLTGASYNVVWDKSADDLIFNDNAAAHFGTGNDLRVYHTGSHSYIENTNGDLIINGDTIRLKDGGNNETLLTAVKDGAVELYHDNTKRFETSSSGVKMPDSAQFELGDGSDLKMWHSGSHSFIRNETGNLTIEANGSGDDAINIVSDGAVELYYDNVKKLSTSSGGVAITGELSVTSDVHFNSATNAAKDVYWDESASELQFSDTTYATFGAGKDLKIYSDGSNGILEGGGTGANAPILINGNTVRLQTQSGGEKYIDCQENGAVELYYDGTKHFETTSFGVQIPDTLRLSTSYSDFGSQMCLGADSSGNCYIAGYNLIIQTGNNDARVSRFSFGHDNFSPITNNVYDLGTTSLRWRNIYTNDLNLSNEGGSNDVDGSWGSYTIQEGEEDLFLVNRRNGKKYKFNLTEVS